MSNSSKFVTTVWQRISEAGLVVLILSMISYYLTRKIEHLESRVASIEGDYRDCLKAQIQREQEVSRILYSRIINFQKPSNSK